MVRERTKDKIKRVAEARREDHQAPKAEITHPSREELENRLKHSFFIIGGGAWQSHWENLSKAQMGFNRSEGDVEPDQDNLKQLMSPEMLKRFRNDVTIMPPMTLNDFQQIRDEFTAKLPDKYVKSFNQVFEETVNKAVSSKLGMRYFEEILVIAITKSKLHKAPKNICNAHYR